MLRPTVTTRVSTKTGAVAVAVPGEDASVNAGPGAVIDTVSDADAGAGQGQSKENGMWKEQKKEYLVGVGACLLRALQRQDQW